MRVASPARLTPDTIPIAPYKGTAQYIEQHPFDSPTSDHIVIYDVDLVSAPLPDPPPTPPITETEARALAAPNGPTIGPDARPTATSATLRMLSTVSASPTPSRPGWIIIWADTHPMLSHPVGEKAWDPAATDCETVVVVDATTGSSPGGTQYCRLVSP